MRTRQKALRAAAATALAAVTLLLAVVPSRAAAITTVANSSGYTLSITSMTPAYAKAGSTIQVSGTLTNRSGLPASGLSVALLATPSPFSTSTAMQDFGANPGSFQSNPEGTGFQLPGTVATGATVRWSASFTAANAGFATFGVYGVEAAVVSPVAGTVATQGTYLPYWPGSGASARMKIAWVWPLMDSPHQTACGSTLTDNSLDGSLAAGGRLGTLLSVGESYAARAQLTWAVDPALLSEAQTMSGTYYTGGNADCSGLVQHRPSTAAKQWLSSMTSGTAADPMFITPYADADVSALSHAGLDTDLQTAYSLGDSVAKPILNRTFETTGWPADGTADLSVLQSMANYGSVTGVVLDSSQMSLTSGFDDAVASVTTGTGSTLKVLLSNSAITGILGRASSNAFGTEQDYLAETAMIASEAPSLQRSIVVAPPRRWDPSGSVANQLLSDTVNAPWLQSASLSDIAASKPAAGVTHGVVRDHVVPSAELSGRYLGMIEQARSALNVFRSLLASPEPAYLSRLDTALAGTESSAWRDNPGGGQDLVTRLTSYIADNENRIGLSEVPKATLAGKSGRLPVSVHNGMDHAVQVRVVATSTAGRVSISGDTLITVQPKTVQTVSLALNALQIGTTQLKLQLVTKDNSPLPVKAQSVSVVSTLYGRAVLVLIIVALAVVVLTSATRWLRQWLANGRPPSGGGSQTDEG